MTFRVAAAGRQAQANGFADAFDSTPFTLEIRTIAAPTDVDDADTGTLLATFDGDTPSFGAASDNGTQATITAEAFAGTVGVAAGTGAHFRLKRGATVYGDGSVGGAGSGADCILTNPVIAVDQAVSISSFVLNFPQVAA